MAVWLVGWSAVLDSTPLYGMYMECSAQCFAQRGCGVVLNCCLQLLSSLSTSRSLHHVHSTPHHHYQIISNARQGPWETCTY